MAKKLPLKRLSIPEIIDAATKKLAKLNPKNIGQSVKIEVVEKLPEGKTDKHNVEFKVSSNGTYTPIKVNGQALPGKKV